MIDGRLSKSSSKYSGREHSI